MKDKSLFFSQFFAAMAEMLECNEKDKDSCGTTLFWILERGFVMRLINPFSHGVFCVSRLTAVGHMRHPLKADLGRKWRRFSCPCVRPSARTSPAKQFKTEWRRRIFTFFALTSPVGLRFEFWKDWLNPQSMLIPNLFRLFWMFASKGFKSS